MVGGPKNNACLTCKRRKIKCDEVSPVCGQCKKGGRVCNGPADDGFRHCASAFPKGKVSSPPRQATPTKSLPLTQTDDLRNQVVALLNRESLEPSQLPALSIHFYELPRFVGYSNGLDAVLESYLFSRQLALQKWELPLEELQLYSKSVTTLRREIDVGMNPLTLMAASLLCQYEVIRPDREDRRSIFVLNKGVTVTLETWGPFCLASEAVRITVQTHLAAAVIGSLFTAETCFAALPRWQNALAMTRIPNVDLWLILSRLPPALKQIKSGHGDEMMVSEILESRERILEAGQGTCDRLVAPTPQNHEYDRKWLFHSSLILLDTILLQRLRYRAENLQTEMQAAADFIIVLLEANRERVPMISTFCSPLAYGAATQQGRKTILEVMSGLPSLAHKFRHIEMMYMFETLTGGNPV